MAGGRLGRIVSSPGWSFLSLSFLRLLLWLTVGASLDDFIINHQGFLGLPLEEWPRIEILVGSRAQPLLRTPAIVFVEAEVTFKGMKDVGRVPRVAQIREAQILDPILCKFIHRDPHWVDGWMGWWVMDEWMGGRMGGWVDRWMGGWVDGWMDGGVHGGSMDGPMDRQGEGGWKNG